jgi:hypothetical protein
MPVVRIEHSVQSFDRWKQAFDSDPADRKGSGVRRYQIFRLQDDPNYVMIDLEFDSTPEAEAFVETMKRIWGGPGKAVMQNPTARIVEVIETTEL